MFINIYILIWLVNKIIKNVFSRMFKKVARTNDAAGYVYLVRLTKYFEVTWWILRIKLCAGSALQDLFQTSPKHVCQIPFIRFESFFSQCYRYSFHIYLDVSRVNKTKKPECQDILICFGVKAVNKYILKVFIFTTCLSHKLKKNSFIDFLTNCLSPQLLAIMTYYLVKYYLFTVNFFLCIINSMNSL